MRAGSSRDHGGTREGALKDSRRQEPGGESWLEMSLCSVYSTTMDDSCMITMMMMVVMKGPFVWVDGRCEVCVELTLAPDLAADVGVVWVTMCVST